MNGAAPRNDRCDVCRMEGHAAWHRFCRGPVNPIALVQFIERLGDTAECKAVIGYVYAVTGMDVPAMRAAIASEMAADAPAGRE